MKLPRALLIVVVILIVLGAGGCVTSIFRGDESGDEESEIRSDPVADLFGRLAPPTDPVLLLPADADCLTANGDLQFAGTCDVTIRPTDDLRRALTLELTGPSTMDMEVDLTVGDEDLPSNSQQVPLDDGTREVSVVVMSGDSAQITLTCRGLAQTCNVLVNPEPE